MTLQYARTRASGQPPRSWPRHPGNQYALAYSLESVFRNPCSYSQGLRWGGKKPGRATSGLHGVCARIRVAGLRTHRARGLRRMGSEHPYQPQSQKTRETRPEETTSCSASSVAQLVRTSSLIVRLRICPTHLTHDSAHRRPSRDHTTPRS